MLLETHGDRAALLLHGFGDSPQTFCYMAPALHEAGIAVHVPLLPGHGRTLADFQRTCASDWIEASRAALTTLLERYEHVGICGLSMGAALAVILAADSDRVDALALTPPYLAVPPRLAAAAMTHRLWGRYAGVLLARSPLSTRDPEESARNLGYGLTTAWLVHELWTIVRRARRVLPRVSAPTLVVQSRQDNRIAPGVAEWVMERIGSTEKRLVFTEEGGHIIPVDFGRDRVIAEVRDWFGAHLGRAVRTGT